MYQVIECAGDKIIRKALVKKYMIQVMVYSGTKITIIDLIYLCTKCKNIQSIKQNISIAI